MAKIMIIDDETDILELVSISLEREGHEVLTADRGDKALEMLKGERPNLIILDVNMPGLNGWETLEEMESRGIIDETPVVMFTIEELVLENMLRDDINHLVDYIEKPFDRSELLERVEGIDEQIKQIEKTRERIENVEKGSGGMGESYEEAKREEMIHERILNKLNEIGETITEEKKQEKVEKVREYEENLLSDLEKREHEILEKTGISSPH